MRTMGWGLLLLMACLPLLAASAIVSAEVDIFVCGDPDRLERTNVAYRWEFDLTLCIIPDRDGSDIYCKIMGGGFFHRQSYFVSYETDFNASEEIVWEYRLGIDPLTAPGSYMLNFTVNFTDSFGKPVYNSFDYPIELMEPPFVVSSFVVRTGMMHTVEIRVETLDYLERLDVWIGYAGPDSDAEEEFRRLGVDPGNYSFEWKVPGSLWQDVEMHDYIYAVTGFKDGHEINIVGPMDESEMEVVEDPTSTIMFVALVLLVVLIALVVSLFLLKKRRKRARGDQSSTTSRPV